jgi:hypothetical protein
MNNPWFSPAPFAAGPVSVVPAPLWPSTNVPASPQEAPPKPLPVELLNELRDKGLSQDRDGALLLWDRSKQTLAVAKEEEMRLRKLCVDLLIEQPKEGTTNIELGSGYVAKAVTNYDYNLFTPVGKRDKIEAVDWAIGEIIKADNQDGKAITDRIFKFSADISLTEYRRLCDDAKTSATKARVLQIVTTILEIKPKAPTLEIKEPKRARR